MKIYHCVLLLENTRRKTKREREREGEKRYGRKYSVSTDVSSLRVTSALFVNDGTLLYSHSVLVFSQDSVTRFSTPDTVVSRGMILSSRVMRTDLDIRSRKITDLRGKDISQSSPALYRSKGKKKNTTKKKKKKQRETELSDLCYIHAENFSSII